MRIYSILLVILLLFSCSHTDIREDATSKASVFKEKAKQPVTQKKHGFIYEVPPSMEESPESAYNFRYDNLLVEEGRSYYDSDIVIAIRHSDKTLNYSVNRFAADDQLLLRGSVKIRYEDEWHPKIFTKKNISFKAYQFSYKYGKEEIFQRSLYIEGYKAFYIVSLSTKKKPLLDDTRSEFFWNSIEIN